MQNNKSSLRVLPKVRAPLLDLVNCQACPRLRSYCTEIADKKRKAYQNDKYWGLPIEGFGSRNARLAIIGLAPGAHGANRTGRIFTGDRSGEWLYRALFEFGLANQPNSVNKEDGLQLRDTYISCIVKCAPPQNRPSPVEIKNCQNHLYPELKSLTAVRVWIALGKLAYDGFWGYLKNTQPSMLQAMLQAKMQDTGLASRQPLFRHGLELNLSKKMTLLLSYHPSQQNTFTGKLTREMFHAVFQRAVKILE